jgi:hypothetical protein
MIQSICGVGWQNDSLFYRGSHSYFVAVTAKRVAWLLRYLIY